MPRKQNTQSENFDKPFPKALRELMESNGTTQSELAAYLQKTRQVISCYCDGSTSPTWETIVGIANYYRVSADWLLGLSDVRSTDTQLREICEYTGLSENSIIMLHESNIKSDKVSEAIVSFTEDLLSSEYITPISVRYDACMQVIDVHYLKAFSQLSQINVPAMQRESCKEIFGRFIDHIRKIRNISPENQEEE